QFREGGHGRGRGAYRDEVVPEPAHRFQVPPAAVPEDPRLGAPPRQPVRGHLLGDLRRGVRIAVEQPFHRAAIGVAQQPGRRGQHASSVPDATGSCVPADDERLRTDGGGGVRIGILGPLRVTGDGGQPVPVAGARLRTLLIRLALDPDREVGTDALIAAVWGDEPPAGAPNALQTLVSRLRRALPGLVVAGPVGYRLGVPAERVDAYQFERLAVAGHQALAGGDAQAAARCLGEALALWRGTPLADVAGAGFARAPAARLVEARLAATEDWIEARLHTAATEQLIAE